MQAQKLWFTGLVAPHTAGGIFLDQGSNPCPLHCKVDSVFACLYMYVCVLAVLGLGCYLGFSVAVVSRGYSLVAVRGLLTVVASLVSDYRL